MSWPPPEHFWRLLYDELPPNAEHARFRAAIEEAVRIYALDDDDAELWERINVLLHGKGVEKLFETVEELKKRPFKSLAARYLLGLRQVAGFQEQFEQSRAQKRRERFYSNVIVACEIGGLELSDSADGPLNRVFKTIVNFVFPTGGRQKKRSDDAGLSAAGVRKIMQRELGRRRGHQVSS
jgi:hypothetical protein